MLTCVYFPIPSSWLPIVSWTAVPAGGGQHFAAMFIKITHYQSACYHRALSAAPCSVIRIPDPAPNTHTHRIQTLLLTQCWWKPLLSPRPSSQIPIANKHFMLPIILTSEKLKRNMMVISEPTTCWETVQTIPRNPFGWPDGLLDYKLRANCW